MRLLRELSPREVDVAKLIGRGWGYHRAARSLGIAPNTVKVHVCRIADKLENPDRLTPLMLVTLWAHDQQTWPVRERAA